MTEERFTHENVWELASKIAARHGATLRSPNAAELGCTCEAYRGLPADPENCPLHSIEDYTVTHSDLPDGSAT